MEKIWLESYPPEVPAEITENCESLLDIFETTFRLYADKPAYKNMDTVLTYRQVEKLSIQVAAYFQQKLALKKGDRIAIMLPNLLQYPVVLFAALRAGLTIVNVNPLYTPRELTHQINDAHAETLIVLANFAHTVEKALPEMPCLKNIIITEIGDLFSPLKAWLTNFIVKRVKRMVPAYQLSKAISFMEVLQIGKELVFKPVIVNKQDIAFLQYTGGTTGVSKGAILTHGNMVANIQQVEAWIKDYIPQNPTIITPLPLYHIFALMANMLLFVKLGGLNILITNPRDIAAFIKLLQKEKFMAITGVNTLFNALLNHEDFQNINFKNLKLTFGGGTAVQKSVAESWQKITGVRLLEGYGLTEASPVVSVAPFTSVTYHGGIGLPLPSTDIKILDEEGKEVATGEVGELCVKGPQVMQGYWNMPQETEKVLSADGWLKTGDMAKMDELGYLYIVERKKDMIDVSGFNVYPSEVEEVIAMHPDVKEVAVVGVANAEKGELVKAYVVKKNPDLTVEKLIEFCYQNLTNYKVPKQVEFREELPKTNVGKILRRVLREENIE